MVFDQLVHRQWLTRSCMPWTWPPLSGLSTAIQNLPPKKILFRSGMAWQACPEGS